MDQNVFTLEMAVRDYECDLQAVVNNAVYQNYLEHARHEYLKSLGASEILTERGTVMGSVSFGKWPRTSFATS